MNPKLVLRLPGEISTTSDMQMIPCRKWRTKEPFDEGERGEWKSWLKTQHLKNQDHGIQSNHFMANRRGKSRSSVRFYFLGVQKTADSDCSHEIRRRLLLGRKVMKNLDSIKSNDIPLPTKVCIVKAMVFLIVMYGCESWTIKKEGWVPKNLCFWIMVLEKTLESPSDCKEIKPVNTKGNQPWIFIGKTDAEASILWLPDVKRPWCWNRLRAGGEGDHRGRDVWMASLTQRIWVWANSGR